MSDESTASEISVRGLVVPTEWSSEGEVLHVSILTSDDGQLDVEASDQERELLDALRSEVVVRLRRNDPRNRNRRATVLSVELVDPDDDRYVLEDLLREPDRDGW